jgi:hypothetical protein
MTPSCHCERSVAIPRGVLVDETKEVGMVIKKEGKFH